jgi:hypothetical protein
MCILERFEVLTATNMKKAIFWDEGGSKLLCMSRPWFAPGSVHVRFVMKKEAMGKVFLRVLSFSQSV